jgi:predicted ABC-type ATPase
VTIRPRAVVVAGPNGSGKTTLIRQLQANPDFAFPDAYINADDIARSRPEAAAEERERAAFREARGLRQTDREQGISHAFETVFSHPSNLLDLQSLKAAGFDVTFVFVTTDDPRINLGRVTARVRNGGHSVPANKVVDRYERALRFLPRACEITDRALIFDSTRRTRLVASVKTGTLYVGESRLPPYLQTRLAEPLRKRAAERINLAASYVYLAQPDEAKGIYSGVIRDVLRHYAVQEVLDRVLIRHDLCLCQSMLRVGENVTLRYRDGYADRAEPNDNSAGS